jgi:hypothetical protein
MFVASSVVLGGASLTVVGMTTANWWEPGTPGFFDIGDASAVLGFLIAISGVLFGVSRWWLKMMRKMMREEITEATAPIHPSANGGLSLADVARKTDKLEQDLCGLDKKTDRLQKTVAESNTLLIRFLSETSGASAFEAVLEEEKTQKTSRKRSPSSK